MPNPKVQIGDIWKKSQEARAVVDIVGQRRARRVVYRVGAAVIDCRLDNFRKWCRTAQLAYATDAKPQTPAETRETAARAPEYSPKSEI